MNFIEIGAVRLDLVALDEFGLDAAVIHSQLSPDGVVTNICPHGMALSVSGELADQLV